MALLIQCFLNVNRDTESKPQPFTIEEVLAWLGYGEAGRPPPVPPRRTIEELDAQISAAHALYTALQSSNGEVQGGA